MIDICNRKGVIDSRKLFHVLNRGSEKGCSKAVITPPAPATPLCDAGTNEVLSVKQVSDALDALRTISYSLYLFANVQYLYGLRVSEVLGIAGSDMIGADRIRVKGLKRSSDRIVVDSAICSNFSNLKGLNIRLFECFDRYFVYRMYKRVGLFAVVQSSKKQAVTHVFRHLLATSMKSEGVDTETIKNFIGHKSETNTKRYGG